MPIVRLRVGARVATCQILQLYRYARSPQHRSEAPDRLVAILRSVSSLDMRHGPVPQIRRKAPHSLVAGHLHVGCLERQLGSLRLMLNHLSPSSTVAIHLSVGCLERQLGSPRLMLKQLSRRSVLMGSHLGHIRVLDKVLRVPESQARRLRVSSIRDILLFGKTLMMLASVKLRSRFLSAGIHVSWGRP